MKKKTEEANCAIEVKSEQECVGENKVGNLITGSLDLGSDDIKKGCGHARDNSSHETRPFESTEVNGNRSGMKG